MKSFIRGQLIKLLPSSLLSIMLLNTAIANTGAVFVATNPASNLGKNGIVMFNRANDGTLTLNPGSPFLTKGYGSGPNPFPSDPNGTYLSFLGCPFCLMSSCAMGLIFINNGYGLGRRLTARGSTRPGRFPIFRCAIKTNKPNFFASGSLEQ